MRERSPQVSDTLPATPEPATTPRARRRWSDLLGLGTIPGSPEEARALFQRRLGFFFAIASTIGWTFWFVSVTLSWIFTDLGLLRVVLFPQRVIHLAITVGGTIGYLWTRGRARTLAALSRADVIGTLLVVGGLAAMLTTSAPITRPEIEMILVVNVILVARAAMVPSTFGRTFVIGLVAAILLTTGATVAYLRGFDPARTGVDFGKGEVPPLPIILIVCAVWSSVTVGLTSTISRVIYGLQRHLEQVIRLGQYTLDAKIGEGGMGVVYRASHAMLRRPTAIKLLPWDRAGERALRRFEREVQLTAQLTHPNTIAIYDYGRTPDGIFYYAMELLDGLDVEVLVDRFGPQPPARVAHVLAQVAGALSEAHEAGLIHRDVKPANIILCQRGGIADFAKVVDFGLVKELTTTAGGSAATGIGQSAAGHAVAGTPLYMAPEAIVAPDRVDARADIYALGAVAYWMLTGHPIFDAPTILEICAKHLHAEVAPPTAKGARDLSPAFEALVLQCLAKSPGDRPKSARAFARALTALIERGDVATWSAAEASSWWTQHGSELARPTKGPTSPLGRTVGVDLAAR